MNEVFKRFDKIEVRADEIERNTQFSSKIMNDRITSQEDKLHPLLKLSEDATARNRGTSIQDYLLGTVKERFVENIHKNFARKADLNDEKSFLMHKISDVNNNLESRCLKAENLL